MSGERERERENGEIIYDGMRDCITSREGWEKSKVTSERGVRAMYELEQPHGY